MDGQDVEVQVLPPLKGTDIDGAPAIAIIDEGKSYKNKENNKLTSCLFTICKRIRCTQVGNL